LVNKIVLNIGPLIIIYNIAVFTFYPYCMFEYIDSHVLKIKNVIYVHARCADIEKEIDIYSEIQNSKQD